MYLKRKFVVLTLACVVAAPLLAQQAQQKVKVVRMSQKAVVPPTTTTSPPVPTAARRMASFGSFRFDVIPKFALDTTSNALKMTLTGNAAQRIQIYTTLYDLRAERVRLDADKSGRNPTNGKPQTRVTRATADESVRLVIRREDGGKDVVECDNAVFTAAPTAPLTANDPVGQIVVTGNVRWMPMGYGFDGLYTSPGGVIEILSRTRTSINLDKFKGAGEPVEPTPKPRPAIAPKGSR